MCRELPDKKGKRTMHLHGTTLDRYISGSLSPEEGARIDTHVTNCLQCAHALADSGAATGHWERRGFLARLVWVEPETAAVAPGKRAERLAA
jgi:anti-sigma factor RsiW